jgi:homocysteine S-methyltransferase
MRKAAFPAALARTRPLLIDGGLATQLEAQGSDIRNPLWSASLLVDQPRAIVSAGRAFLDSGAECIATASYQASREGFARRGLPAEEADRLMLLSVELAAQARDEFIAANPGCSFVPLIAASIGPYGAILHDGSEYRGEYFLTDEELRAFHAARLALFDGSIADVLACETVPAVREARVLADLLAVCDTPAWVSFSCRDARHISDGTTIEEAAVVFAGHPQVMAVGVNCTAPRYIAELVGRLRRAVPDKAIIAYPNSGETWDPELDCWTGIAEPLDFAAAALQWIDAGAAIVGGCCRTGPEHIRAMRAAITP